MRRFWGLRLPDDEAPMAHLFWGALALGAVTLAAASILFAIAGIRAEQRVAQPQRIVIQPPPPIRAPAFSEFELARMADTLRTLAADRDRLATRLDRLERSVDDITAAVPKEKAPIAVPTPAPELLGRVPAPDSALTRTEFAVDLGADASIEALRARWAKLRDHSVLVELKPLVSVRDGKPPGTAELRLVAGPFANAADAARACAALAAAKIICQTTVFDGQRLARR
jgi:hypothetical protein